MPPLHEPILPVVDLLAGRVVRAQGGERARYRPLHSLLCPQGDPAELAARLRARFGFARCYTADLDAIAGRPANEAARHSLIQSGLQMLLDAGPAPVDVTAEPGVVRLAALEWLAGPAALAECWRGVPTERRAFSLDLRGGAPLGSPEAWPRDPLAAAESAVALGAREMVVLDLAAVGLGGGPTVAPLCRALARRFPELRLVGGGGVRNAADCARLLEAGCHHVLVATALHNGGIDEAAVEHLRAACRGEG